MSDLPILSGAKLHVLTRRRGLSTPIRLFMAWVLLVLGHPHVGLAFGGDAVNVSSQEATVQEVVAVANKYIKKNACEASRAEPSVVATMTPYTPEVAEGRAVAKFAVLWSGDLGCRGGSGTNTMNILLIEKHGTDIPNIAGANRIENAANVERIVATTPDTLTVDVYTWAEDDPQCCASSYERWTLRREPDPRRV